jgi:TonB-linked SusC/RagA family outer membrane protein
VATQYQQHEKRTYDRIDGSAYLEAKPLRGLVIRATGGYNFLSHMGEKFDEAFSYGAFANPINALTYSAANDLNLLGNIVATYSTSVKKHNVKVMGGYEASKQEVRHFNTTRTAIPIDVGWSFNLATGAVSNTDRFTVYQNRMLSQFGRLNYNFDEKYLFEANIRRDASAPKFALKNIWGIFPSFSAGWRISQEQFFQNVPYITNLKLRASTGTLGSDKIPDFVYLKTYTSQFSTYAFDNAGANKVSGFYISKFSNGDVQWEVVNMSNVAIDLKAFQNKFSLTVDYYIKDTKNLLYSIPIPPSVGIAVHNFDAVNPEVNVGTMRNTGIDIEFGYNNTFKKLALTLTGNTSFMTNEMKVLRNDEYITGGYGGQQIGGMTRTQAGHPVSSFYGYVVQQMLNSNGDVYAVNTYAKDGLYQEAGTAPGDFMYKDISGPDGKPDGDITAQYDRIYIGNPWPKMTYALNVNMVYNNLVDLAIQFQGVQGVDVFNANKAYSRNFFGDNNTTTAIFEAWTPENHTQNPRNIASDPNHNWSNPSTYFVEDGSYLKLRNVQLGVTIPKKFIERVNLKRVRIYANANNLLTITKYSGLDPEVAGSNTGRGVDFGYYPQVRTYGAGIEVQF